MIFRKAAAILAVLGIGAIGGFVMIDVFDSQAPSAHLVTRDRWFAAARFQNTTVLPKLGVLEATTYRACGMPDMVERRTVVLWPLASSRMELEPALGADFLRAQVRDLSFQGWRSEDVIFYRDGYNEFITLNDDVAFTDPFEDSLGNALPTRPCTEIY